MWTTKDILPSESTPGSAPTRLLVWSMLLPVASVPKEALVARRSVIIVTCVLTRSCNKTKREKK